MPGIGVIPFCKLLALINLGSGIPGVEFDDIGTGLVENPGGMSADSFTFATELIFSFVFTAFWQAKFNANDKQIRINKPFLDIKIIFVVFKRETAVPI